MVCCVIVAMMFALPFILMRAVRGLFTDGSCSMAWRPASQSVINAGVGSAAQTNYGSFFESRAPENSAPENSASENSALENSAPDRAKFEKVSGAGGKFTIVNRARSFRYAGRGAIRLLRFEHSAWIQLTIASIAIVLAIVLNISAADWRWIIVACGLVLALEGLNTAVERTCDRISVAYCGQIKVVKDVAAGAVLLGSIAAALIGVITFLPYLTHADSAIAAVGDGDNTARVTLDDGSARLSVSESLYSRFAKFHCIDPVNATPVLPDNDGASNRSNAGA